MEKRIQYKLEDVPLIAGYIIDNLRRDLGEFSTFSSSFNENYIHSIEQKRIECLGLMIPDSKKEELRKVGYKLNKCNNDLRLTFNKVDNYIKLAGDCIDFMESGIDLKDVYLKIKNGNVDGFVSSSKKILSVLRANQMGLFAFGMRAEVLDQVESRIRKIDSLNKQRNQLKSEYRKLAQCNIKHFNELWGEVTVILHAAEMLYSNKQLKLREYSISNLRKRLNSGNKIDAIISESPWPVEF